MTNPAALPSIVQRIGAAPRHWAVSLGIILPCLTHCATPSAAERRVTATEEKMSEARDANKLLARGRAFYRVGDLTRAIQYFNDAIKSGANESVVARPLMLAYVEAGQYRSAIQFGQDYLRRQPNDYRLHYLVASMLVAVGNHHQAVDYFKNVIRLNGKFADAHFGLGVIYRDQEVSPLLADEHFRAYLALEPEGSHADEAKATLLRSVQ